MKKIQHTAVASIGIVLRQLLFNTNFILGLLILANCENSHATHIVGGQLSYRQINTFDYEITLLVRRDCKNGREPFDPQAVIGIFYGNNQLLDDVTKQSVAIPLLRIDYIQESIDRFCIGPNDTVCVHQATYKKVISLLPDPRGYLLAYQRCCRNRTLTNILDPLDNGTTYTATIPGSDLVSRNSNPLFGAFPKIYACVNERIVFDHSAEDQDGDSLVYRMCAPLEGRDSSRPQGVPLDPPFREVVWHPSYGVSDMMSGPEPVRIHAQTGLFTATPGLIGQFLVGVCVDEYRDGKFLSTARRDFEINVVPCGLRPKAAFTVNSVLCDGVNFRATNTSTAAQSFRWFFDFRNNPSATDTVSNPRYVYPRGGTYEVVLIAINGSCTDTARQMVTIVDHRLNADFNARVNCQGEFTISITDQSSANTNILVRNYRIVGPGTNIDTNAANPVITIAQNGRYTISLTITDNNGCTATVSKIVEANTLNVDLIPNTVICSGDSIRLVRNPNPNYNYVWNPTIGLNLSTPSDPIAKPNTSTTYKVTVSGAGCFVEREVTVSVRQRVNLSWVGDTTTCDGNILLVAYSDSTRTFKWSDNMDFRPPLLSTSDTLRIRVNDKTTIYLQAGSDKQCIKSVPIQLLNISVNLKFPKDNVLCATDTINVTVTNTDPNDQVTIQWEPSPFIIGGINTFTPQFYFPSPGRYSLRFSARNQHNCVYSDSINFTVVTPPVADFEFTTRCGSLTVSVETRGGRTVLWDFGDNKGKSNESKTSYTYEKSGRFIITLTVDSVCTRSTSKQITVVFIPEIKLDTILSCHGTPVSLNPSGSPNFDYEWRPSDGLDNPKSHNPTATVSKSTTFYVSISDPNFPECILKDSVFVRVPDDINLKTNRDTILCEAVPFVLKAVSNNPLVTYQWCDKGNNVVGNGPVVTVMPQGDEVYTVKAKDEFGCISTAMVSVKAFSLEAEVKCPDFTCRGDTGYIEIITKPGISYTYNWEPKSSIIGANNTSRILVAPAKTTSYTVTVSNGEGCNWTRQHIINVQDPGSLLTVEAIPAVVVGGQPTQLNAIPFRTNWTYKWAPDDGSLSNSAIHNPIARPSKTTTYTVTVTDELGCTASATIEVKVTTCEDAVFIPNAFSPNGDNINDELYVRFRNDAIQEMELIIYNRWGQEVFKTNNKATPWDGRLNGVDLNPDVYGFYLKFRCFEQDQIVKKGNISLLR